MIEITKVKLCRGLVKEVQKSNLTKQLEFYLQLKSITVSGRLFQRNFILLAGERTGESRATLYRRLKSLLNCGFAHKDKNGDIVLLSYDKLFERFGFSKKNLNLVVYKINSDNPWHEAAKIELAQNLKHQDYITFQKHVTHKYGCTEVTSGYYLSKLKRKERRLYNSDKLDDLQKSRAIAQRDIKALKNPDVNYDITLTCKNIANILGFKSKSSGWRVLRQLENYKMIKVQRREDIFTGITLDRESYKVIREDLGNSFYLRGNSLMKRSSNKVKIN